MSTDPAGGPPPTFPDDETLRALLGGRASPREKSARQTAAEASPWVGGFKRIGAVLAAFGAALVGLFIGARVGHPAVFAIGAGGLTFLVLRRFAGPGGARGRRQYAMIDALLAAGRYRDAALTLQLAIGEHPEDPAPYLRLARLQRDVLEDAEEAARYLRKARDGARMDDEQWLATTRELAELLLGGDDVRAAAPELARLVERGSGSVHAAWAAAELGRVKKSLRAESD